MKYAFRFPQRSLHWGLFRVPNDGIISADSLGSDMLARRYPRGTAGRAVSVAPKKVARMLILILGTLGFNFACQGCHSQKAAPAHPSSSPIFRRWHKVDEKASTRSLDGSETLDQSSRLLFMRTAGNGGCSPGRLTSDRDGDRWCRART
jgi:hypothetical protein